MGFSGSGPSSLVRAHVQALVDLVLPRCCIGCGAEGQLVCDACRTTFGPVRRHRPEPPPAGFPGCWSGGAYADALRTALLAYKERGRRDLAAPLAARLLVATRGAVGSLPGDRPVLLVPVPSSGRSAADRGGDHVRRLARPVAVGSGLPVAELLAVRRGAADAAHLGAAEREQARRSAFAVRRGALEVVAGADVVLLDDIVTTGWTLAVCASALRAVGARHVHAATVAATHRRT